MLKKAKDFRSLLEAYNKDQPKKKSLINLLNIINLPCNDSDERILRDIATEKSHDMNEQITKEIDSFERKKIESIQV